MYVFLYDSIQELMNTQNNKSSQKSMIDRKNQIRTDLMQTRGHEVRFALRVKVHAFPEDVCATWIMLAVRVLPAT